MLRRGFVRAIPLWNLRMPIKKNLLNQSAADKWRNSQLQPLGRAEKLGKQKVEDDFGEGVEEESDEEDDDEDDDDLDDDFDDDDDFDIDEEEDEDEDDDLGDDESEDDASDDDEASADED